MRSRGSSNLINEKRNNIRRKFIVVSYFNKFLIILIWGGGKEVASQETSPSIKKDRTRLNKINLNRKASPELDAKIRMKEEKEWKTMKYYRTSTGITEIINDIELTVDGEFRYTKNKRKINIFFDSDYPNLSVYINGNTKQAARFRVHIAIISTFSITPLIKDMVVDHIDRNKSNYSINNLRFVSLSENQKNKDSKIKEKKFIIFNNDNSFYKCYSLHDQKEIIPWIKRRLTSGQTVASFSEDSYNRLKESIIFLGKSIVDNLEWKDINDKYSISSTGLLRQKTSYGYNYTYGSIDAKGYYVGADTVGKGYSTYMHHLVARMFLNDGKRIIGKVINHIDTDPLNNCLENLEIVTQSENINNPKTKEKQTLPIKCNNLGKIVYFKSITDCARILKMKHPGSIVDWLKKRYKCTYPGLSEFEYVSESEMLSIEFIESVESLTIPEDPRDIKTRQDMINFVNRHQLKSFLDFKEKGFLRFYKKFTRDGLKPIYYYKEEK